MDSRKYLIPKIFRGRIQGAKLQPDSLFLATLSTQPFPSPLWKYEPLFRRCYSVVRFHETMAL